jgi:hypothetical protein
MGITGNIDVKGNVTAQNFIVSSSVTNITYQSLSGSTIFGDTSDDIHRFTGSIRQTSTSTGSFGTIRTGTTIGSLSSGISFGDGDTGIYEKTDDNIIITAGNSLESLKIAPTAVTWRTDSFNINTSTSTYYGIRMSPGNSTNTILLAGSGNQTIDFSKVGVLKTSTTLNANGAAFEFQGTMNQMANYSATSQFVKLDPVMSSSNAVATSSYTMLDMAGTIDMTGQTQETIRSLHIHPTKTNIVNYTAIDADGDIITTGNISGSATSTGSFGAIQSAGNITPKVDDTSNLGSAALRFSNVFTTDLQLSNEGKPEGNEVDGTTGSWTIQEGEDNLYLLNRKNGKKYKFKLEEIG